MLRSTEIDIEARTFDALILAQTDRERQPENTTGKHNREKQQPIHGAGSRPATPFCSPDMDSHPFRTDCRPRQTAMSVPDRKDFLPFNRITIFTSRRRLRTINSARMKEGTNGWVQTTAFDFPVMAGKALRFDLVGLDLRALFLRDLCSTHEYCVFTMRILKLMQSEIWNSNCIIKSLQVFINMLSIQV